MSNKYLKNVKMWYVIVLFIIYMFFCFLIPSLINGKVSDFIELDKKDNLPYAKNENSISEIEAIKLLLTDNNKVIELSLDDYLKGVLIGEVPMTYELEALKAQAVVARTYTLYKMKNAKSKHILGADMCDDINCCQAFKTKEYAYSSWDDNEENEKWAKCEEAVSSTKGEVILYNNELINAFFHAHSGGKTENVKYLWSKEEIPYLVSVDGNEGYIYQDTKSFNKEELKNLLKNDVKDLSGDFSFEIKDYTGSGRVNNVSINGSIIEATRLRLLTNIKSTNFRIEQSGDVVTFYTVGYGHGIGLSQEGANQMAINGSNYIDIIKHYYTGVNLGRIK